MSRLLALIASDYHVHYRSEGETPTRSRALFLLRALSNPSLHATILIRLAYAAPRWTIAFWRNVLLTKHTIDIGTLVEIGPGLDLPHPMGVVLGAAQIGANCTIYHNVTIGARAKHQDQTDAGGTGGERWYPWIGDDVVIYSGAMILGPIRVGDGAIVGARAWVDRDVAPGAVVSAGPRSAIA